MLFNRGSYERIIFGTVGFAFLFLFILGVGLYRLGYFNDDISGKTIQVSKIHETLNLKIQPNLPNWEIEKIIEKYLKTKKIGVDSE